MKNYLSITTKEANEELNLFLQNTVKEFNDFFDIEGKQPLLFLLDKRADLDLIWGSHTERWLVGAFKNNCIYILNPNVYETESSHKKEEFWQNLKHEYCHSYYTQITKCPYPMWLNEGLASYKSGKILSLSNGMQTNLLTVFNYFEQVDKDVYPIGQFWVEYLLSNYGDAKLVNLIKCIHYGYTEEDFSRDFRRIYNFNFDKETFSTLVQ